MDNTGKKEVRVRFAPSPTGGLHVGGVRTALFNYMFAKKHGGTFMLRIEDTDSKRFDPVAEEHISASLKWLGIIPAYSPMESLNPITYSFKMRQSDRHKAGVYKEFIDILLKSGHAYVAFDTPEELAAARDRWKAAGHGGGYNHAVRMDMRNSLNMPDHAVSSLIGSGHPYVVRFKIEPGVDVEVNDIIRGKVTINTRELDDKVLVKNDGVPTYHMASVVDDHDMGISHVIRGEEWLPSTPLHILLYRAFGWDIPEFAHLPLLLNTDGSKMSKRTAIKMGYTWAVVKYNGLDDGEEVDIPGFKELGYEADALVNFLALVGWHPTGDTEIATLDELIADFTLERCGSSGAIFDFAKLNAFNFDYVRRLAPDLLVPTDKFTKLPVDDYMKIVEWTRERSHKRADAPTTYKPFLEAPTDYIIGKKHPWSKTTNDVWLKFVELADVNAWDPDSIEKTILAACSAVGVEKKTVMAGLRAALTGGVPGPDLIGTMTILGPNETVARLKTASTKLHGAQGEHSKGEE